MEEREHVTDEGTTCWCDPEVLRVEGRVHRAETIAALTERVQELEAECALWRSGMASPAYLRMAAVVEAARGLPIPLHEDRATSPWEVLRTALAALKEATDVEQA